MPDHWLRLHRCTHHDERRGGYGFFARLMGLIDACMMDGRNELTDAFFSLYCSLARFWSRSLYGKKAAKCFYLFFFGFFLDTKIMECLFLLLLRIFRLLG
jgi:hypothetical protein